MFDYDEGSIFDPMAFSPKKKPEEKKKYEKPVEINLKPLATGARNVGSGAFGIIKEFQRVRSPEYQLKKTNAQLKSIEASKKLIKARAELKAEREKINVEKRLDRKIMVDTWKSRLGLEHKSGMPRMKY